ncbi:MAG: FtsX-like permease family protein [Actinobacteria bacterium]|nr:FtsX-like permease family protein [Actinomycetota bacterium]MBM4270190.1 FtsX-like permease family protein [Deltaproteobacteria bacterium]
MISAARLAWLQLRRQKVRLAVAVAGVAFAVILMFMQLGFMDALFRSAVNLHVRLDADLVLLDRRYNVLALPTRFPERRLLQARAFDGVRSIASLHTGMARFRNPESGGTREIFVLGVDPARPSLNVDGLEDGLDLVRYPNVALFDATSRPEYGPVAELIREKGNLAAEANRRTIELKGLFRLGTSFGVDGSLITSDLNYRRLFPAYPRGAVGIGLVRLEPGADPIAVRDAMRANLPPDVKILTHDEFIADEVQYWATATPIGFVFTFGVIMGIVVGMIIVYQILFADISDHLSEYATLKAMGYAHRYLAGVVLMEASLLAFLGFAPGIGISSWLYGVTKDATHLPMEIALDRGASVLLLTLAMCWASGLIAIRKLRTADPAEVF